MAIHTIVLDEVTEADLQRLSAQEGQQAGDYAARLLARAVRAARPRPEFDFAMLKAYAAEEEALADSDLQYRAELLAASVCDIEALKTAYAEFAEEDIALSEATVAEHAALLAYEDEA